MLTGVGFCAFTHKAGIHAKAILANPTTYEVLNRKFIYYIRNILLIHLAADFGMTRYGE